LDPILETTNGTVRGTARAGALVFRGIRYGASTGGANRFLPPQKLARWSGVIDAIAPGPSAPQLPRSENTDPFFSWYSAIQPVSEDCLFLNLFTPSLHGRRPIMFWIHGGGWREGSGTAPGFDGSNLAASQDVVVVTVNHRLNAFGFLGLGSWDERFADSGNAGLLDIVAALAWVRENAEAFGGDPANVTLFGQSGGASKIAALMSTRRGAGLFHKAIVQSSAGVRLAPAEDSARMADAFAKSLGLEHADPVAMQALPMENLLYAMRVVPGPFRGIIDGRTFFEDAFVDKGPPAAAQIPLLIGCTNTESTYYLRNNPGNFQLEMPVVRRRLAQFFKADDVRIDHLIRRYRDASPGRNPSRIMIEIATDQIFKRQTYGIGLRQAASASVPVHAYLFEWETPIEGGRMGSPHTIEVPFVFGTTDAATACIGTSLDLSRLSETLMSIWASFARTGSPSIAALPHWQQYEGSSQMMMVLNYESRLEQDPGAEVRAALSDFPPFGSRNAISALSGG
jgi:para-nitrobenzyl esterase